MRISDWSSDVCSSDLVEQAQLMESYGANCIYATDSAGYMLPDDVTARIALLRDKLKPETEIGFHGHHNLSMGVANSIAAVAAGARRIDCARSEEHTSELQSLMRISYAVFCLKKKNNKSNHNSPKIRITMTRVRKQ